MKPIALITAKVHPWLIEKLESRGWEVAYQPEISYDDMLHVLPEVSGLIITTRLPARFSESALNLSATPRSRRSWVGSMNVRPL